MHLPSVVFPEPDSPTSPSTSPLSMSSVTPSTALTYLFISHDLSVIRHISDRIAVMYLGKIVEVAENDELFESPLHPYTKALLMAVPIPDPDSPFKPALLKGEVPSPVNPPPGCRFHPRCPYAKEMCKEREPRLRDLGGHQVACHLHD